MDISGQSLSDYTKKIKAIIKDKSKVVIKRKHIEVERIHRNISVSDVEKVLETGKAEKVRETDKTVFWVGTDPSGRKLTLQCSIVDSAKNDTLVVKEAETLRVGTVYDPSTDDAELIKKFLEENEDYELNAKGDGVQRKIPVEKI